MKTWYFLIKNSGAANFLVVIVFLAAGCLDSGPAKIQSIAIDPQATAASAVEKYDADQDRTLGEPELSAIPALADHFSSLDTNGDSKLSQEEIAGLLQNMFTGTSLLGAECQVILDGRPLPQATVRLIPEEILGDAIYPAEGITDESGTARPTIAGDYIPQNLQGARLLAPGLYRVEITHPQITLPDRYNTATEFGMLVDPTQRGGDAATFKLQSK